MLPSPPAAVGTAVSKVRFFLFFSFLFFTLPSLSSFFHFFAFGPYLSLSFRSPPRCIQHRHLPLLRAASSVQQSALLDYVQHVRFASVKNSTSPCWCVFCTTCVPSEMRCCFWSLHIYFYFACIPMTCLACCVLVSTGWRFHLIDLFWYSRTCDLFIFFVFGLRLSQNSSSCYLSVCDRRLSVSPRQHSAYIWNHDAH